MLNGTIKISHAGDVTSLPKSISLRDWAVAAHTSIEEFKNYVEALLPHGVPASSFPLESISDDLLSPLSPHKQDKTAGPLRTWTDKVLQALFNDDEQRHRISVNSRISLAAIDKWLITEQNTVLSSLVKVLSLCCGIGLQEFKYNAICFDSPSPSTYCRNVWILKNGLIAFNDPVKSFGRNDDSTRLFIFPRDMTQHLAIYLYGIRPIGVELLSKSHQDIPRYSSYIWAHVSRPSHRAGKNIWLWSGTKISRLVQAATDKFFGVILTPTLIQRIESDLFSSYLSGVYSTEDLYSPVDQQAQHNRQTSLSHYGWVSHFPSIQGLRLHQPVRHIVIGEIWHALLDLGPVSDGWKALITNSELTKTLIRRHEAIKTARRLILERYHVRVPMDAGSLLESLPFVFNSQVCIHIEPYTVPFKNILLRRQLLETMS